MARRVVVRSPRARRRSGIPATKSDLAECLCNFEVPISRPSTEVLAASAKSPSPSSRLTSATPCRAPFRKARVSSGRPAHFADVPDGLPHSFAAMMQPSFGARFGDANRAFTRPVTPLVLRAPLNRHDGRALRVGVHHVRPLPHHRAALGQVFGPVVRGADLVRLFVG